MKLKIDKENNIAYLSFCEIEAGDVDRTVMVHPFIGLDFDRGGALLGIEFLDARVSLAALENDQRIPLEEIFAIGVAVE